MNAFIMQSLKSITLSAILFLATTTALAQNFAPIGAEWYYTEKFVWSSGDRDFLHATVTKDTIIQGKFCREIYTDYLCYSPSHFQYVYSSADSVLMFDKTLGIFQTLYDFGSHSGDSWNISVKSSDDTFDTITVQVDSISYITINTTQLKVLHVNYHIKDYDNNGYLYHSYKLPSTIIERIGDIEWLFNFLITIPIVCDYTYSDGLRCYEDSVIGHYETGIAPSCTYTYVGIKETSLTPISIYPNPTSGLIELENISTNYTNTQVTDITGRALLTFTEEERIDISYLQEGIYFLKVTGTDGKIYTAKVLKVN